MNCEFLQNVHKRADISMEVFEGSNDVITTEVNIEREEQNSILQNHNFTFIYLDFDGILTCVCIKISIQVYTKF